MRRLHFVMKSVLSLMSAVAVFISASTATAYASISFLSHRPTMGCGDYRVAGTLRKGLREVELVFYEGSKSEVVLKLVDFDSFRKALPYLGRAVTAEISVTKAIHFREGEAVLTGVYLRVPDVTHRSEVPDVVLQLRAKPCQPSGKLALLD